MQRPAEKRGVKSPKRRKAEAASPPPKMRGAGREDFA